MDRRLLSCSLLAFAFFYPSRPDPACAWVEPAVRLCALALAVAVAFGYVRAESNIDAADAVSRTENEPPFGFKNEEEK